MNSRSITIPAFGLEGSAAHCPEVRISDIHKGAPSVSVLHVSANPASRNPRTAKLKSTLDVADFYQDLRRKRSGVSLSELDHAMKVLGEALGHSACTHCHNGWLLPTEARGGDLVCWRCRHAGQKTQLQAEVAK